MNKNFKFGLKNKKSFIKILSSKKWHKMSVWADGSWTSIKNNRCEINFIENPLFSLTIDSFNNFDGYRMISLAENINSDLQFIQKCKIADIS